MTFSFLLAAVLLTLSPGPDILYVLSLSLRDGAKKGVVLSLGLVSGILVHTTLLAFGFSTLIRDNTNLYNVIKYFGALYLLYLAYKTYRATATLKINNHKSQKKNKLQLYKRGFLMNVLNPKVTLFFLSLFPKFISPNNNMLYETYKLGLLFMAQAIIIFSTVAILASQLKNSINKPEFHQFIKWFQIVVLLGIGIFVIL